MSVERWGGPSWEAVLRDGPRCVYCGLGDNGDPRAWQNLDLDHLVPRGHGYDDVPLNLVPACTGCNSAKGTFDPSHNGATPLNPQNRSLLIERARSRIKERNVRNAVPENYRPLLDAIRSGAYPKITPPGNTQLGAAVDVGLVTRDVLK